VGRTPLTCEHYLRFADGVHQTEFLVYVPIPNEQKVKPAVTLPPIKPAALPIAKPIAKPVEVKKPATSAA
jgi:hypothetical protein